MVAQVLRWLPDTPVELVADSASCGQELLRNLPERLAFVGAMSPDAALRRPRRHTYELPLHIFFC